MKIFQLTASIIAAVQHVAADWQYRSRPDLSPPTLNITIPTHHSVESGFIFTAPYSGFDQGWWGPQQSGPYFFRDNGDLVWFSVGRIGGWITNFQPTIYQGEAVLQAFEGVLSVHGRMYGKHSLLNRKYETVKTFVAQSHRLVSCHEFKVTNNGTVLIKTPLALPTDLSQWGEDEGQSWIVSNGFQGEYSSIPECVEMID